jgi:hypothetical protein
VAHLTLIRAPFITSTYSFGEGEVTAVELAAWVDGKIPLESVAGIAYRDGGTPRPSAQRPRTARNLFRSAEEPMVERRLRKLLRRRPPRYGEVRRLEVARS